VDLKDHKNIRTSALYDVHKELGAKFTNFGGWEMPLSYPQGTLKEHLACRNSAVVFDVSHLGTVRLEAKDSFDEIQKVFTNDLNKISVGRAQYSHLLNENAGIEDDVIIWWLRDNVFDVMPNASNTERVLSKLRAKDITSERSVLAIQGPKSRELAYKVLGDVARIKRFCVDTFNFEGISIISAGTGYTGEDGFEIAVPNDIAADIFLRLIEQNIAPAGLGARDTLRLEAGLPLHGHEIGPDINPLEAGLSWVVAFNKADFIGKKPLEEIKKNGPKRKLIGLKLDSRNPVRQGDQVINEGQKIGVVTSGNFSPVLKTAIAMALVDKEAEIKDKLYVEKRGQMLKANLSSLPFI
jgi:aminomethyltransferase